MRPSRFDRFAAFRTYVKIKCLNLHVLCTLVYMHVGNVVSPRRVLVTVSRRGEQRNFYRSSLERSREDGRNGMLETSKLTVHRSLDGRMTSRYYYRPCLVIIDASVVKVFLIPLTTWLIILILRGRGFPKFQNINIRNQNKSDVGFQTRWNLFVL